MSLRLGCVNLFLKTFAKPRLRRLTDPTKARADLERSTRWFFRPAPFTLTLPIRLKTISGQEISALSILNHPAKRRQTSQKPAPVIFYIHGGGFIAGSPLSHAKMLSRLSQLTGLEIIAPYYRLAPEHAFPAAYDDILAAFLALLGKGYAASDIIIGGDSAGGGLAFALMAKLCADGITPRALFAFSPLTDMRFHGNSITENAQNDPILPTTQRGVITEMYLRGHSPDDPRASPLLADFPHAPPVFLQFSNSEILRDDSLRMAAKLQAGGTWVEIDAWENTPHVWVLFDGVLPEARQALRRLAAFLSKIQANPDPPN